MIDINCTARCKSNYHTTTTAPIFSGYKRFSNLVIYLFLVWTKVQSDARNTLAMLRALWIVTVALLVNKGTRSVDVWQTGLTPLSAKFQLYHGCQLLVEETGENHIPVASHWQTLSHNVCIEYNSRWTWFQLTTLVVIGTDCIGSSKSNCHMTTMAPFDR